MGYERPRITIMYFGLYKDLSGSSKLNTVEKAILKWYDIRLGETFGASCIEVPFNFSKPSLSLFYYTNKYKRIMKNNPSKELKYQRG